MRKEVLLIGAALLGGCSEEAQQASSFNVVTQNPLVIEALPSIRQACPGMDIYSSELKNVTVQEYYRTTIVFDVPETAKLPPLFRAGGHTCFIEIDSDGKGIFIDKGPCKSICLNRSQVPEGQLALPLQAMQANG
ncbi:hypothetical protein [Metapseudomonas otitidis]|uniref:hypothetical protein n=1 Tax=Metapseudomonas otitidis TaxID=319939 RepID=UPI00244D6318|nr:hypothetical protein [Pseudomonas otitidis]MDG9783687.1 hypothetical protein [Pseudomonas otitidis]